MSALPSARQLKYQDWELGLFLHFGVRTFNEGYRDWDERKMQPGTFNPSELDCEQWARTAAQAGVRYMVLVAKHHDGFANWPSRYTDFSVASTPWRGGKGDVVAEFVQACRRYGLKPGLYYSPADSASPVYHEPKAYDDYFLNQISELLLPYGTIDILWFDGCGSAGHTYDWARITKEIRRMQPNILIFSMGDPDFRWVGNESGIAPQPCWNTVRSIETAQEFLEEPPAGGLWLPAECDCRMRAHNWFYSDQDAHTVKSVDELMGLYYYSVGRGCNLILNIGPDRRGLLPEPDAARLLEFGDEIKRRFAQPIATLADCARQGDTWVYRPANPLLVDHCIAQEQLELGERVRQFALEVVPTSGEQPITVYRGRSLGHKVICEFPLVSAREVRLHISASAGEPALRTLSFYQVNGRQA
ncbi:MAG: alpha-L-fucosidase [Chloroflexi bacterium]|nr:alpha-L-fucosidase [Chloroflexota bacterium]